MAADRQKLHSHGQHYRVELLKTGCKAAANATQVGGASILLVTPTVRREERSDQSVLREEILQLSVKVVLVKKGRRKRVVLTICQSSGVGQVQLPADTTPGAEYQLDSVAEVGHDPREGAADPIFVGVHINDQELLMELDTGAKFSIIPEKIWKDKWPELSFSSCDVRLSTYDGNIVPILCKGFVSVIIKANILI